MKPFILHIIKIYQLIVSPLQSLLPGHTGCKFHPTCSEYMYEAVRKYGTAKGVYAGVKRIGRCGPWGEGGYDPV